jgi:hypothetical protein
MPTTTPRRDAKDAFKAILDAAGLDATVYRDIPYEGAEAGSVVLTLVSGSSRRGAVGLQHSATERAMEQRHRIQIDCYHDDKVECDNLADKVEQTIMDHLDVLRSRYGISDVGKIVDTDVAPPDPLRRLARVLMDFEFVTYRALA